MQEDLLLTQPTFKLYKESAVSLGSFLGGPLVAGYLIAENFKQLGQTDKVKPTWIIAILVTIVIFGGIFLIPNIEKVPNYLIPLIYTWVARFLVQNIQGASIKTHIETGGQTYSNWRVVWIGLIGLAILAILIILITLAIN